VGDKEGRGGRPNAFKRGCLRLEPKKKGDQNRSLTSGKRGKVPYARFTEGMIYYEKRGNRWASNFGGKKERVGGPFTRFYEKYDCLNCKSGKRKGKYTIFPQTAPSKKKRGSVFTLYIARKGKRREIFHEWWETSFSMPV